MILGEELYEFQSQVLYGTRDSDDGSASMVCPEGEVLAGDDPQLFCRGESKITPGKIIVLLNAFYFIIFCIFLVRYILVGLKNIKKSTLLCIFLLIMYVLIGLILYYR